MLDCVVLRTSALNDDGMVAVVANGDVPVGSTEPNVDPMLELVPNIVVVTGVLVFTVANVDMVGLNTADVVLVFKPKVEDATVPKDGVVIEDLVLKIGAAKEDVLLKDGIVAGAVTPNDFVVDKVPNDCTVVAPKTKDEPEVLVAKGGGITSLSTFLFEEFEIALVRTPDVAEPKLNTGAVVTTVLVPNTLLDVCEVVTGNAEVVFGEVNNGNVYGEELFSETPCLKPLTPVVNEESE